MFILMAQSQIFSLLDTKETSPLEKSPKTEPQSAVLYFYCACVSSHLLKNHLTFDFGDVCVPVVLTNVSFFKLVVKMSLYIIKMRSRKWHRMSLHSSVTVSEWMTAAQGRADPKLRVDQGSSQIYAFFSLCLSLYTHTHFHTHDWRLNSSRTTEGKPKCQERNSFMLKSALT